MAKEIHAPTPRQFLSRGAAYIQYTTVGLIVFMILFSVSGSFVAAFNCNPPKYMYDIDFIMQPDRAEHCFAPMTSYGIFMYQAVLLFCLDIILLLLPLPALWSLTMSRGKGLVLFLVFGSGASSLSTGDDNEVRR